MQGIVWHTQKFQDDNIFYQKTCENIAQHFQDEHSTHTQLPPKNTRQRIIEKNPPLLCLFGRSLENYNGVLLFLRGGYTIRNFLYDTTAAMKHSKRRNLKYFHDFIHGVFVCLGKWQYTAAMYHLLYPAGTHFYIWQGKNQIIFPKNNKI